MTLDGASNNSIREKWKMVTRKAFLVGVIVEELKDINQQVRLLGTDKGLKKNKKAETIEFERR